MFSARIFAQISRQNVLGVRSLVQLRGRPFLPGSDRQTFPKHLAEFRDDFPRMIKAPSIDRKDLKSYGVEMWPTLKQHIEDYGCIGIRGLPIETGDDFSEFIGTFGIVNLEYVGGSGFRKNVAKRVATASDDPPDFTIEPHNEMAYLAYWPHLFMAYCDVPSAPGCGGEACIADVRDIYRDLDKTVVDTFKKKGIRYHHYFPDKSKSNYIYWQESFGTDSREEAEKKLQVPGQSFKWGEDGALSFWVNNPAMSPHYRTGEMLWFNQAHSQNCTYFKSHPILGPMLKGLPETKYPFTTYHGDGSPIDPEHIQHIREVTWRNTVGAQLQKSDVILLDNMLIQHARLGFTGERRILVSLAKFQEHS